MRKIVLSACVTVLALLTFAHLAIAQGQSKATAKLSGAAEVPGPGDTKGSGTAELTFNPDKGEVCYELTVTGIEEATAAHIHEGAAGKAGSVKVALDAPKTGSVKGCKSADAATVKAIMANPADYYINVHNKDFPNGAVRGQLSK